MVVKWDVETSTLFSGGINGTVYSWDMEEEDIRHKFHAVPKEPM